MGTEITTTSNQNSLTAWRKPSLSDDLDALVNSRSSYNDLPVISPEQAAALAEFVEYPEPPIVEEPWLEAQIGTFMIKPQRGRSNMEWKLLLEVYVNNLRTYSRVDLGYAFGRLMRESKWFPDISEIIALADYAVAKRKARRLRAEMALMKHKHQYEPPIPDDQLVTPEDIERIKAEVEAEFAAKNQNKSGRDEEQAA